MRFSDWLYCTSQHKANICEVDKWPTAVCRQGKLFNFFSFGLKHFSCSNFELCILSILLGKWIGLKRWAPNHKRPLVYFHAVDLLPLIYQTNMCKHDGRAQRLFRKTVAQGFLVFIRHMTSKMYFIVVTLCLFLAMVLFILQFKRWRFLLNLINECFIN